MGWRTRTSALPIRDLRLNCVPLTYVKMEFESGVVFLWRRLICPHNSSLRMFWYRDLNSSHFFPRFGLLEHEANRTHGSISATFIGSRQNVLWTQPDVRLSEQQNDRRMFCLSPMGWIVSVGWVKDELNSFKFCAKIWSAPGTGTRSCCHLGINDRIRVITEIFKIDASHFSKTASTSRHINEAKPRFVWNPRKVIARHFWGNLFFFTIGLQFPPKIMQYSTTK